MPITPDIPKVEAAIVAQTNEFRATGKLQAVNVSPALTTAARAFAKFLAAAPIFSHEADGRRPVDRIKAAGYEPCATSENLAWRSDPRGFETLALATQLVDGWKASPGHRKNLLMGHATQTGVAVVKASREQKYFAVQLFARPAALSYTFEVVNTAGRAVTYAIGGRESRIEPRIVRQHTECEPVDLTFEIKSGGLLAKGATARFEAKGGQVYRLTAGKGGEIAVEVRAK
jgi:hypothetical protein